MFTRVHVCAWLCVSCVCLVCVLWLHGGGADGHRDITAWFVFGRIFHVLSPQRIFIQRVWTMLLNPHSDAACLYIVLRAAGH